MDWKYWVSDFLGGPLLGGITAVLQGEAVLGNTFSGLRSQPLVVEGLKLFLFGILLKHLFDSCMQTLSHFIQWIDDRFRPRLTVSAEFKDGDVTYAWVMTYMLNAKIWQNPRHIFVKSKNSHRKWKFLSPNGLVDYVPHYGAVQFFRWRQYWMEISRTKDGEVYRPYMGDYEKDVENKYVEPPSLLLKIYTRDPTALYEFVEECRLSYVQTMRNSVTVYTATTERYSSTPSRWTEARVKRRRPLDSLLLEEGKIEDLLRDAREFLESESWYQAAGIPYRRGYLLYGPPGTGKNKLRQCILWYRYLFLLGNIYLNSKPQVGPIISLSSSQSGNPGPERLRPCSWDDSALAEVVSQVPPKSILLIEDIDCAFPSREEQEREKNDVFRDIHRSSVTLSGVLNVLDGVGSEEGRLFMATTNYIEKLDPALIRPGRIDRRLQYKYTNKAQARALFMRFFHVMEKSGSEQKMAEISTLADTFAESIPEDAFSVAELQGFLLLYKTAPQSAVDEIKPWIEKELEQRQVEEERKRKEEDEKERRKLAQLRQDYYGEFAPGTPATYGMPPPNDGEMGFRRRRRRGRHTSEGELSQTGHGEEHPAQRIERNDTRREDTDSQTPSEVPLAGCERNSSTAEGTLCCINGSPNAEERYLSDQSAFEDET